jgi:hypothetical protein
MDRGGGLPAHFASSLARVLDSDPVRRAWSGLPEGV